MRYRGGPPVSVIRIGEEKPVAQERRQSVDVTDNERGSGLTLRAVGVGILFIVFGAFIWLEIVYNGVWGGLGKRAYWVYYDGYAPNNHALLPVFLIVFIVNPIIKRFGPNLGFTKRELLTINNMAQFGVLIIGSGFFERYIPGGMMGLSVPALQNPFLYGDIAERFSSVFFVDTQEIMRWFQDGPGPVPWSKWFIPFLTWSLFMFSIVGLFFCLGTFIRRRWTEMEHLRYPIGVVKLAYISGAMEGEEDGSLWKNKLIWIGIIAAFVFSGGAYFHTIWPWFPDTDMSVIRGFRTGLLAGNPNLQTAFHLGTTIHPVVMSSMWFVMSLDLLFSIWFFYIIRSILAFIFINNSAMGLLPGNTGTLSNAILHSSIGASVALAITYLWLGKDDIRVVIRKAFSLPGSEKIDDSQEPLSYKEAFWGFIGCGLFFILFCSVVLQMKFLLSLISLLLIIFIALALARMRNEAGLGQQLGIGAWPIQSSFIPLVGANAIGYENAGFGAMNNLFSRPILAFLGGFLESWKMGDELGEDRRTVTRGIALSILIATLVTALIYIPWMYKLGFNQTISKNYANSSQWAAPASALKLGTARRDPTVLFWYIYPFVSVVLLGWLRTLFAWWPFHPVGFTVGATIIGGWFVDMAFIVWLIKAIVMRYGGYQSYKKVTPVFLGLGIGQLMASLVGFLLSTLQMLRII
jgi:hypothetical protein